MQRMVVAEHLNGRTLESDLGAELASLRYYSTIAHDAKDDLLTPRDVSNEKRWKRPTKKNSGDEQRPEVIDVDEEIEKI